MMGNRRFVSNLGTGLSLVVAGVLVCAAVIAVVAFSGFSELSASAEPEAAVMPSVAAERATRRQPIVLGVGTATPTPTVTPAAAGELP